MTVEERLTDLRLKEPVVTRNRAGLQVLLGVRKDRCDSCAYGERVDTVWASLRGEAHRISWCRTCFNAECAEVDLDTRQQDACRELVRSVALEPPDRIWACARPAIEDLESRGLA